MKSDFTQKVFSYCPRQELFQNLKPLKSLRQYLETAIRLPSKNK